MTGLREQELLYIKEKPVCTDGHGCDCESLHLVSCKNGMTIIAIGWTRGNKKAVQAFLKKNSHISFELFDEVLAKKGLYAIDIGKIRKEQLATHHIAAVKATFDEVWNILETKEPEQVQVNQHAKKCFIY